MGRSAVGREVWSGQLQGEKAIAIDAEDTIGKIGMALM